MRAWSQVDHQRSSAGFDGARMRRAGRAGSRHGAIISRSSAVWRHQATRADGRFTAQSPCFLISRRSRPPLGRSGAIADGLQTVAPRGTVVRCGGRNRPCHPERRTESNGSSWRRQFQIASRACWACRRQAFSFVVIAVTVLCAPCRLVRRRIGARGFTARRRLATSFVRRCRLGCGGHDRRTVGSL